MPSSGMLRRVAVARTGVSEEPHEGDKNRCTRNVSSRAPCHCDDGGDMFLRNVGSYKSHTAFPKT
jgi:hypothetical protein